MTEINLHTTGNTIFLIFTAVAAIAVSYFVYRRTIPPVATGWRILLITLRSLAIISIVLLLFEPILSITRKKEKKPIVAVLVDNSGSMALVDEQVDRRQILGQLLQSPVFSGSSDDFDFQFYPFAHALGEKMPGRPDSLTLDEDGTDISQSLTDLKQVLAEQYLGAVVMLTDGADNLGQNPARFAETYGVPIFPVGIGDPTEQKDVLVTDYVTNEIAYAGTRIPVDVYVKSSGFENQRVTVNLLQDNRVLDTEVATLAGDGLEQKVRLHFTPDKEGMVKYDIQVPKLEGELTQINNSKTFYTKVLKSKLQVLLVTGGPSADFRFLQHALNTDDNLEVASLVEKGRGQFYDGVFPTAEQLLEKDCVILLDFPRRSSPTQALQRLREVLAKGKPLMFLAGKNTDYNKLAPLENYLPFDRMPQKTREQPVYIDILPQGLHHPVLRISEDEFENAQSWQELPPVFANVRETTFGNSAQSLASVDADRTSGLRNRNVSVVSALNTGKRKAVAVLAYGLWRWDLMMSGVGKSNENYVRFLRNSVRWLTTQEDSKLVRITANKEIYRSGEEVKFTAQVYYEDYQPVEGADVTVQLKGGQDVQELALNNIGDGRYEGSFQVLDGGDYRFTGTAHEQGRVLGRDTGRFSVEAFSLEYQQTRMNDDLLRRIAKESGGAFLLPEELETLPDKFSFPAEFVTLKNEWEIWNRVPLLVFCIAVLATEWFVRKRKGML